MVKIRKVNNTLYKGFRSNLFLKRKTITSLDLHTLKNCLWVF